MDWFVKAFLKSSLIWLALGITLGLAMVLHPPFAIYRTAHLHMNLLGFVTMMIFGVAYHVLPRFTGHALHDPRLAGIHVWLSNVGLAVLAAGFAMLPNGVTGARAAMIAGGTLSAAGAYAFVFNIWRTIDGRAAAAGLAPARPGTPNAPVTPSRRRG